MPTNQTLDRVLKPSICLVVIFFLSSCVSQQMNYIEAQNSLKRINLQITKTQKIIDNLQSFIRSNQNAISVSKSGGSLLVDGKNISLEEARENITNARSQLHTLKLERDNYIEEQRRLLNFIRDEDSKNKGLI